VEELPFLPDTTSGPVLAARLTENARAQGVTFGWGDVLSLERVRDGWHVVTDENELEARTVILATGGRETSLGVVGEIEYRGRGVSECATCDGPLFAGRCVVVAGSGHWARSEAAALAATADEVIVFTDLIPYSLYSPAAAVGRAANVEWRSGERLVAILGDDSVAGVLIEAGDGRRYELACSAVFACTDREPGTTLIAWDANDQSDSSPASIAAGMPGIFLAGEARTGSTTIASCVADGAAASERVVSYLNGLDESLQRPVRTTVPR
jgi:thioredoxin reductase (NADPH)